MNLDENPTFFDKVNDFVFSGITWNQSLNDPLNSNHIILQIPHCSMLIGFSQEIYTQYIDLMRDAFEADGELSSIISFSSFEKRIRIFMKTAHEKKEKINPDSWNYFIMNIQGTPRVKYEVFYPWPSWMVFAFPNYQIDFMTWYGKDDLIANDLKIRHIFEAESALVQDFKNVKAWKQKLMFTR